MNNTLTTAKEEVLSDEEEDMEVEGDDDEIEEDPEEYKKMIKRNLAERDAFLKSLQIDKDIHDLKEIGRKFAKKRETVKRLKQASKEKKVKRQRTPVDLLPRREPSRRLRKLPAPGETAILKKVEQELDEEEEEEEKQDERLLGTVKLEKNEAIFSNLEHKGDFKRDVSLKECSLESFTDQIRCMRLSTNTRIVTKRIQSAYMHPTTAKCLSFAGCVNGELGIWDPSIDGDAGIMTYKYHKAPINCISAGVNDNTKLFTTSHDGTICCLDLENYKCDNVYATDFRSRVRHLTWHDQIDAHTFLLAHGAGDVGTLDLRSPKVIEKWDKCFTKSCRTVQHNPGDRNKVLVSSGTGGCLIYDMRKGALNPLSDLTHSKGLTSAFFSPNGQLALTTCNDDVIRIFSVDDAGATKLKVSVRHNNFTGRWLTVFRAKWFPQRSDAFHVGSLLLPRMIQVFNVNGDIIASLEDDEMTTIQSVQACHPTLPAMVAANSTGRVHLFTPPDLFTSSV